jgi:hypothetical protein
MRIPKKKKNGKNQIFVCFETCLELCEVFRKAFLAYNTTTLYSKRKEKSRDADRNLIALATTNLNKLYALSELRTYDKFVLRRRKWVYV